MGGECKTVEADETFVGVKKKNKRAKVHKTDYIGGNGNKPVSALVERDGHVHSQHVPAVYAKTLRPILVAQVDSKTFLMNNEAGQYLHMTKDFPVHQTVNHGAVEYVRGDTRTNTIESYFSGLKRSLTDIFHHVSQQHLRHYFAEFDFRFNNRAKLVVDDVECFEKSISGIVGKHLTYRGTYAV